MNRDTLTNETIDAFRDYLQTEEKSEYTIDKYMRDARVFADYADGRAITKELVIEYKNALIEKTMPSEASIRCLPPCTVSCTFLGWTAAA